MKAGTFRWFIVILILLFIFGIVSCNVTVKPQSTSGKSGTQVAQ